MKVVLNRLPMLFFKPRILLQVFHFNKSEIVSGATYCRQDSRGSRCGETGKGSFPYVCVCCFCPLESQVFEYQVSETKAMLCTFAPPTPETASSGGIFGGT